MKIREILLLTSLLASITFAQFEQFKKVDLDDQVNFASEVTPVVFENNIKLFVKRGFFLYTYSTSSEIDSVSVVSNSLRVRIPSTDNSYSIASQNDNVFLATIDLHGTIILSVSEDQGINFASNEILDSVTANKVDLSLTEEGLFILTLVNDSLIVNYTSNNSGTTWDGPYIVQNTVDSLSYAKTFENNDGSITAIISKTQNNASSLFSLTSNDEGKTWDNEQLILETQSPITKFDVIKNDADDNFLIYNKILRNNAFDIKQADVFYITSSDGSNWSDEVQFTSYLKDDNIGGVTFFNSKPLLFISSTRFGFDKINQFASIIGETTDKEPPAIFDFEYEYSQDTEETIMRVYTDDLNGIDTVSINIKGINYQLLDDGNSADINADDNIYGISLRSDLIGENALININNIYLPFNNRGVLATVHPTINYNIVCDVLDTKDIKSSFSNSFTVAESSSSNMQFTNELSGSLMFSGGFLLSGFDNDSLWANGVAASSIVEDYVPGNVNSIEGEPSTQIYKVKRSDPAFSLSWQNWKYAVDGGAYFYDGNGDGEYDPIDLNNNGTWDSNEDKPDLLYDEIYFSVINDGVAAEDRRYSDVEPKGIEVRQTIFASAQNSLLSNTVFVRYSLLNTGTVNDTLKDVIFSMFSDIDIGGIAGYGGRFICCRYNVKFYLRLQ